MPRRPSQHATGGSGRTQGAGRAGRNLGRMRPVLTTESPVGSSRGREAEVLQVDPNLPIYQVRSLETLMNEARGGDTIMAKIMAALAGIALVLSVVGVYGVMAYSVSAAGDQSRIRRRLYGTSEFPYPRPGAAGRSRSRASSAGPSRIDLAIVRARLYLPTFHAWPTRPRTSSPENQELLCKWTGRAITGSELRIFRCGS